MATIKMGIKQAEHEVKQLTDLMERFNTLSGLHETKRKPVFHKEKTYSEGTRASVKDEDSIIPKPVPPMAQGKVKKSNSKRLKDISKIAEAKLHSGTDVGVRVFRLKDSLVEENVLQSVPQDDVKYSFHQPPLKQESSLYQEALVSSRKYVLANRGITTRQSDGPQRRGYEKIPNGNILSDRRKEFDLNPREVTVEKANTVPDFNSDRKRLRKQKHNVEQTSGNIPSTKEKTRDSVSSEAKQTKDVVQLRRDTKSTSQNQNVQDSPRKVKNNTIKKRLPRHTSPPTAVLVDFGAPQSLNQIKELPSRDQISENLDRRDIVMKDTKKVKEDVVAPKLATEKTSSGIKMPKFVRTNEEMYPSETNNMPKSVGIDGRAELSASGYYLSTYPKNTTSLSSIQSVEAQRYSPESKMSFNESCFYPERSRVAFHHPVISPPPPTPRSRMTPSPQNKKSKDEGRIYPLSSIQKVYDVQKVKIVETKKQQKRPLAGKQGRIRKIPDSLKDTQMDTLVQGRSLTQNEETVEKEDEKENKVKSEKKKSKLRREKSKSGGSTKKESAKNDEKDVENVPVFNAYESFVIKSKHHVPLSNRVSPDLSEIRNSKLRQKSQGKLAPLMKLNTEMRKSKFILARTDKNITGVNESPVHLVSDPITFSVRHPSHISSDEIPHVDNPPRDLLLGRINGLRSISDDKDQAVVVFFHHDSNIANKGLMQDGQPKKSKKDGLRTSQQLQSQDNSDLRDSTNPEPVGKKGKRTKTDKNDFPNHVAVQPNAAQYSMILRQHRLLKDDQETFLRLMQDGLIRNQTPETLFSHTLPRPSMINPKKMPSDFESEMSSSLKLSTMLRKFSQGNTGNLTQKTTGYTMFTSRYPIKHENVTEHVVSMHDSDQDARKAKQAAIRLNYIWPDPRRRFSYPTGPVKSKSQKSKSTSSEASSTKSLKITDLNFELHPDDSKRQFFMPKLGRSEGKSKNKEDSDASPHKQPRYAIVALPRISKNDLIKEVDEDEFENAYICFDPHSAAILPDPGTTSYRLTHDVSFDEGSRYRTNDFPHGLKGKDEPRAQQNGLNGLSHQFGSAVTMRGNDPPGASGQSRLEGRMPHGANNSFKDSVPLSLIRMEDRCDLPLATSPSSPAISSAIAASTSNSSFMPPPSASQRNAPSATAMHGSNITFRLHKEKQNWNYRLGDLSINGGGYSNATPTMSNPKQELESINPLNMTTAVQRNLQTRERASAAAPKSRLSTRYSSKFESSNGATYADPCISAPPSFQQRLTDLSILESETVKYERNRKLRRKKNQDKDS